MSRNLSRVHRLHIDISYPNSSKQVAVGPTVKKKANVAKHHQPNARQTRKLGVAYNYVGEGFLSV